MRRTDLVKAAQFVLARAATYKGKLPEMMLDAMLFSHLRSKYRKVTRQHRTSRRARSPRIDFLISAGQTTVIELAHRKRGTNGGFSPSANSSELSKLSRQVDRTYRYLLVLDLNAKYLDTDKLKALYRGFRFNSRGRPPRRKAVTVVYVHPRHDDAFLWRQRQCQ